MMPTEGVTFMEEAQTIIKKGQLKLERSMAEETLQVLMQQLDGLSARNEELERKLNATYQEMERLRGGDS